MKGLILLVGSKLKLGLGFFKELLIRMMDECD